MQDFYLTEHGYHGVKHILPTKVANNNMGYIIKNRKYRSIFGKTYFSKHKFLIKNPGVLQRYKALIKNSLYLKKKKENKLVSV